LGGFKSLCLRFLNIDESCGYADENHGYADMIPYPDKEKKNNIVISFWF
jgi:hypothetical protein